MVTLAWTKVFCVYFNFQEGGLYSAEDADSLPSHESAEKLEGAFYVWTFSEIESLLSQPLSCKNDVLMSDLFCHHYNIRSNGNVDPSNVSRKTLVNIGTGTGFCIPNGVSSLRRSLDPEANGTLLSSWWNARQALTIFHMMTL